MRKSQSDEKMVGVKEKANANWMQKTMETEQEKGKMLKEQTVAFSSCWRG